MAETKRQTKDRLLRTFKMLTALNYRVEEAIRVNEPLETRDWDALVALSQSRAIETQLNVLAAALENCEEELNKVWVELARDSYHDFYEFMNREEEYVMSPHQRLIGDLLMASANKETMRFMLSMPPGHCKPVWEEEMITMGDGTQRLLKHIDVGDTVITSQGRARRVEAVWEQGALPEWVIETESGRKISAAHDHPFLTPRGWVNVQDLRLTDSLAGALFDQADHTERSDAEFALAGYLIGDGSVTDNNCNFTNADPAIWEDFDRCVTSLGFKYGGVYRRGRATTKRLNGGAKGWCRAAGIDGLNSHTKRVPSWVFEGSNRQIGIFIAAYWDCDGSVHKKGRSGLKTTTGEDRRDLGIELVSVSSALLADIRLLLTRMGIRSLLRERQNPHAYRLRVGPEEACALFKQLIPLKGEKCGRLAQWDPAPQFMGPYLGDRIVALSATGQKLPMRCLTVEEDHSFLVQGMVVHNSTHSSHHFPAWWFGKFPKLKFLQAGHSQDFVANELGAKVKSIIDSDDYRLVFPEVKLRTDMRAKDYWGLSNLKGKYVAKGAGQGISGFRGNYGMVDDPYKSRADAESATIRDRVFKWYSDDFSTRLLPGSPLGIIMCLTGDTNVTMADGSSKRLDQITAGDSVRSWQNGSATNNTVIKASSSGLDDIFQVRAGGSLVRGNRRHPFLVQRTNGTEWVQLSDLKIGDLLVQNAFDSFADRNDYDEEEAWTLGFMLGDGWVTKNIKRNKDPRRPGERLNPTASWVTCVADCPAYPERVARAVKYLEERFDATFRYKTKERYWRTEKAALGRWLYAHGLANGAKGKRVPQNMFEQAPAVRQAFLDGFMAADGNVTVRGNYEVTQTLLANTALVADLRHLARSLGYPVTNITNSKVKGNPPNSIPGQMWENSSFKYHHKKQSFEPFRVVKVREIKPVGRAEVFDLTVADSEAFIADGLVVHNTRWHSDDLCGRISDREEREQKEEEARQKEQQISQLIENLEEQKGNQKKYRFEIINLPAICEDINDPLGRAIGEALWDELFDLAALENLKADMTSASWNSLYQGTPIDAEGGAISGDWFQRYEKAPSRGDEVTANEVRRCVVSVDAANTAKERSDFTVITVWYEDFKKNHYLIDVVRKQMEFPEMSAEIARVCRRYNADALLIEAKGNGLAYLQQKKDGGAPAPLIPIEVGTASKEFRFDEVTPMIEGGQVYLPTRAIWLADFEKELISFPFGKNDDQVDSTSQYLKWARHKGRRGTKKLGGTGHRTRAHA